MGNEVRFRNDDHSSLGQSLYGYKFDLERTEGRVRWPSEKYAADPVGFAIEIIGFAPTEKQTEIALSVLLNDRTTVRSGRKIGKSRTMAWIALWFFCTHDNATIVLTAPSERQITEIVWHDVVQLFNESGRCLSCKLRDPEGPRPCEHSACIDGELSATVRTGLRASGGARRLFGSSPRNADHARGISGPNQLWLLDESPGIPRPIYDAADGNRAGGAKILASGNPTVRTGWFFESHTTLDFNRVVASSLDTPNNKFGRRLVPGLADRAWIEEKRRDYGEDDARWYIEVLGEFPTRDLVTLITETEIGEALDRWATAIADGILRFGIDPAGGGGGDNSTIVCRRGAKVLEIKAFMGGTDTIMGEFDAMLTKYRIGRDDAVHVNFDAASSYGKDLYAALQKRRRTDEFLTFDALESRGDARNNYLLRNSGCARPKDAFWLNMTQRLKTEVGIPFDEELIEELKFAEWEKDLETGLTRLIDKKRFRAHLGRSPDKSDALAYCLWEGRVSPLSLSARRAPRVESPPSAANRGRTNVIDPYGHLRNQRGGGALDPYAGLDPNRGRRR